MPASLLDPYDAGSPASAGDPVPVFIATWCRSVGATWTLELREAGRRPGAGQPVEWICSGVPNDQPVPDALVEDLLADLGLLLHRDPTAPPGYRASGTRQVIGHATREPAVLELARRIDPADVAESGVGHPCMLAALWIGAGFSTDAATGWLHAGVLRPRTAQLLLAAELDGQRVREEGSVVATPLTLARTR